MAGQKIQEEKKYVEVQSGGATNTGGKEIQILSGRATNTGRKEIQIQSGKGMNNTSCVIHPSLLVWQPV